MESIIERKLSLDRQSTHVSLLFFLLSPFLFLGLPFTILARHFYSLSYSLFCHVLQLYQAWMYEKYWLFTFFAILLHTRFYHYTIASSYAFSWLSHCCFLFLAANTRETGKRWIMWTGRFQWCFVSLYLLSQHPF